MAMKLESENSKIDAEKAEMQPKGGWITFPFLSGIYSLSPPHFPPHILIKWILSNYQQGLITSQSVCAQYQ
jgi:hypothetical protein